MLYSAQIPDAGGELWMSDGTAAGTRQVADINPGPNGSNPSGLVAVGSTVFFAADDGVHGVELWKSDGTSAGTVLVADLDLNGSGAPARLTQVGAAVYFSASDGVTGRELWKS